MLHTDDAGHRTPDDGRRTMDAGPSAPYYKITGELKIGILGLFETFLVQIILSHLFCSVKEALIFKIKRLNYYYSNNIASAGTSFCVTNPVNLHDFLLIAQSMASGQEIL